MKKVVLVLFIINIFILVNIFNIFNNKTINNNIIDSNDYLAVNTNNYSKSYDFNYIKSTNSYNANSKDDILNIVYTILNNGYDDYNFKCNYDCSNDIIDILNDKSILIVINNLVNPYNSFDNINISYVKNNEYKVKVSKLYSEDEISIINKYLDIVSNNLFKSNMTDEEKLLMIHDYIANIATYKYSDNSNKASNLLMNGEAVCSGYSDLMAIFLDRLNIPNFKVTNDTHVWNAVYINNEWRHIDITFDDYNDELSRNYFLINTSTLKSYKNNNHNFDNNIYSELD